MSKERENRNLYIYILVVYIFLITELFKGNPHGLVSTFWRGFKRGKGKWISNHFIGRLMQQENWRMQVQEWTYKEEACYYHGKTLPNEPQADTTVG